MECFYTQKVFKTAASTSKGHNLKMIISLNSTAFLLRFYHAVNVNGRALQPLYM